MEHEPRAFLRYSDGAVNLVGTDAVLAVHYLPHCSEPLIEAKWTVLEYRASLEGELRGGMAPSTMPAVVVLQKQNVFTATSRAGNAIGPAPRDKVVSAVDGIAEVDYRFLECARLLFSYAHVQSIRLNRRFVKYIVALKSVP